MMDGEVFLLVGLIITSFLLLIAWPLRFTNGLFFARSPQGFMRDRNDPRYEKERQAGKKLARLVFRYIPPFFLIFLFGYLLSLLIKSY